MEDIGPPSKKIMLAVDCEHETGDESKCTDDTNTEISTLEDFAVDAVLAKDVKAKSIVVCGSFQSNSDKQAVVIVEKQPLSPSNFPRIFSSETQLKLNFKNDIYSQLEAEECGSVGALKLTTVYPATDKHIRKYSNQEVYLVHETLEDYQKITKPFIKSQSFSKQWVYNILDGHSEADRVIYSDSSPTDGFVIVPDLKWDGKDLHNIYLVAIVRRRDIFSLRDISTDHLTMLKGILCTGKRAIKDKYSIPEDQLKAYVHYQPSYYHFHVHITHVSYVAAGAMVGRAHLLDDVIDNIENIHPQYYQKKTLTFALNKNSQLLQQFRSRCSGNHLTEQKCAN